MAMGSRDNYVLICIFLSTYVAVCVGNAADDGADPSQNCKLTIWKSNTDITGRMISVLNGEPVIFLCDARCPGTDYKAELKWFDRNSVVIEDFPGRVYSEPKSDNGHLQNELHIKSVNQDDIGKYVCVGWLGQWVTADVSIDIETQAREFKQMDP